MTKRFYIGPKIEIREDYINIKDKSIKLKYQDIRSIKIKYSRLNKAGILFVLIGIISLLIILYLFILVIQGVFIDSSLLSNNGFFFKKRVLILLVFIFIGGPFYIIFKIKKHFKKYLMLIIKWKHSDFRIQISELGINVNELWMYLEGKIESLEFDIPNLLTKKGK